MTPTLQAQLETLDGYLRDLAEIEPPSFEAFERDKMLRRYAERMLHMTIEHCIHIGIAILTDRGFRAPENFHDVFLLLGDRGVLTPALVNSMTMMVELRNLLVYEYDVVDHMMVYSVLKKRREDLAEYARAVRAYACGEPYAPSPLFVTAAEDS